MRIKGNLERLKKFLDKRMLNLKGLKVIACQVEEHVQSRIRLSILGMIAISFTISSIAFVIVAGVVRHTSIGKREVYTYTENKRKLEEQIQFAAREIMDIGISPNEGIEDKEDFKQRVQDILENEFSDYVEYKKAFLLSDIGENITLDDYVNSISFDNLIKAVNENEREDDEASYKSIYPIIINDNIYYLFVEAEVRPTMHIAYNNMGNILGFISALGVFISILFKLSQERIAYLEYLSNCLKEISTGNLNYEIEIIGKDELAAVATNIMQMEQELKKQIEEKLRVEKSKNELVSNVAHDLRTPLTSIIGYIGLVKNKAYSNKEEEERYLNIAYEKAEKLKILIEQLFELTKLHQQENLLKQENISLTNLLNQLVEELILLAEEKNIKIETYIQPTKAMIKADVQKITRVFENLIENAIKYTKENQTIYIELKEFKRRVYVAISNPCEDISSEEANRFFDRFYRADQSRNSKIGGSGLGLAIVKHIVELHKGIIDVKVQNGLISFKVGLLKERQ